MTAVDQDRDQERDGRHARWDDHRERRRREILDAAVAVVEDAPPGAELTLQDVATRAGLVRTVVQRHFGGQAGLLRATQADAVQRAFDLISEPLDFTGSLHDVVRQVVRTTIVWVDTHPGLHALIEQEVGDGEPSELSLAMGRYADFLAQAGQQLVAMLGTDLTGEQVGELRLLVTGVIGQVRATVAAWLAQEDRVVDRERLEELLATWISLQVTGHTEALGVHIDARAPLGLG